MSDSVARAAFDSAPPGASAACLRISPHDIQEFRSRPGFAEAVKIVISGLVDIYDGNRLLNQVINDRGRAALGLMMLYLHFADDSANGGLTLSNLQRMCVETDICSPGRVTAMVALMRFGGYLEAAPSEADRRRKRLVPTERMLALHRRRIACQFEGLALLIPEGREALAHQSDLRFTRALLRHMGASFRAGARPIEHAPELEFFFERSAGFMLMLSLLLSGAPGDAFPPRRPVPISISALSRRFTVSRAQIMKLLRRADEEGLLRRTGTLGEEIELLPRLTDSAERFFAAVLVLFAAWVRGALVDLGAERTRRVS